MVDHLGCAQLGTPPTGLIWGPLCVRGWWGSLMQQQLSGSSPGMRQSEVAWLTYLVVGLAFRGSLSPHGSPSLRLAWLLHMEGRGSTSEKRSCQVSQDEAQKIPHTSSFLSVNASRKCRPNSRRIKIPPLDRKWDKVTMQRNAPPRMRGTVATSANTPSRYQFLE